MKTKHTIVCTQCGQAVSNKGPHVNTVIVLFFCFIEQFIDQSFGSKLNFLVIFLQVNNAFGYFSGGTSTDK